MEKCKKFVIYRILNMINGKSYIGFTQNFESRKKSHINAAAQNKSQSHIHRAIRKYGIENFQWSILYKTEDKEYCKNIMEPRYIKLYESFTNGYNMTYGGEGTFGYSHSLSTKEFLSNLKKDKPGRAHSLEYRNKISGNGNYFYGKKHSEETKSKISETKRKNITNELRLKLSESAKNRKPISDKTRKKMSISAKGRKHHSITRAKLSVAHLGRKKYSDPETGKEYYFFEGEQPDGFIKGHGKYYVNSMLGKKRQNTKHTKETRKKISMKAKERFKNKKMFWWNNGINSILSEIPPDDTWTKGRIGGWKWKKNLKS